MSTLVSDLPDISALSWHRKNPLDWSSADVLDWIYYGSGLSEMNLVCLKGETFQGISGRSFCSMTSAEFEKRDEEFGIMLFNSLHSFLGRFSLLTLLLLLLCIYYYCYYYCAFIIIIERLLSTTHYPVMKHKLIALSNCE